MTVASTGRRSDGLALLALLLLWMLLLFARVAWTPDEPRELALTASQLHAFTPVPLLGGEFFAEKPPLTYWLAAAAQRLFGASAAAARVPNLLYEGLAFWALLSLGGAAAGWRAGWATAACYASSLLLLQTQAWLACDALLIAGVALALLGAWRGLQADAEGVRWRGYALFQFGLLLAFFAKGLSAWLVPVATWLVYILWQRRGRELLRTAFWAPAAAAALVIGLWILWIARTDASGAVLRALFWDNVVGRLLSLHEPAASVAVLGHASRPGQYVLGLPIYVLPWTALYGGALLRSWRAARATDERAAAPWRFGLAASLPAFVALSLAATARDIYAAPVLIGLSLLVGLSVGAGGDAPRERLTMGVSAALVAALSLLIAALLAYAAVTRAGPARLLPALAAAGALCSGLFALAHWHRTRRADSWSALRGLWLAHVATLCCAAIVLLPLMNSLQDLSVVAQRLRELSAGRALILWRPDETTVAMVDLYLPRPACIVRGSGTEADRAAALRDCLAGNPRAIVLTQAVADKAAHAEWRAILSGQAGLRPIALPEPSQPLPAGAYQLLGAIQRVGGRAYVLLAPPSSERK